MKRRHMMLLGMLAMMPLIWARCTPGTGAAPARQELEEFIEAAARSENGWCYRGDFSIRLIDHGFGEYLFGVTFASSRQELSARVFESNWLIWRSYKVTRPDRDCRRWVLSNARTP